MTKGHTEAKKESETKSGESVESTACKDMLKTKCHTAACTILKVAAIGTAAFLLFDYCCSDMLLTTTICNFFRNVGEYLKQTKAADALYTLHLQCAPYKCYVAGGIAILATMYVLKKYREPLETTAKSLYERFRGQHAHEH